MLHPSNRVEQQELAAWAIGTAVKNSYDFQLWVLESDFTHPSVLSLKKNKIVNHDVKLSNIENGNVKGGDIKIGDNDKSDKELDVVNSTNEENNSNSKNMNALGLTVIYSLHS